MQPESDSPTHKSVTTYVPAYQKQIWAREADELGMSQAEYVRNMIQAGRKSFEDTQISSANRPNQDREVGVDLHVHIRELLSTDPYLGWDELSTRVVSSLEEPLEKALERLQKDNVVRYSGQHGGYCLVKDASRTDE